jgi:acid phosphatase (class A)
MNRLLFLFLVLASVGQADWTKLKSNAFRMEPPPEEGSAEYERDFKVLHKWQNEREQAACDLAATHLYPTINGMFGPESKMLTAKEIKKVRSLMEQVMKVSIRISGYFKSKFERPRPYNTDSSIVPCIEAPPGNKSYPSSHATSAMVSGCVLAEIFPAKAKALTQYGKYLGDLRVIVGVHHPSDVKAGQDLGSAICETLLSDEEFKEAVEGL